MLGALELGVSRFIPSTRSGDWNLLAWFPNIASSLGYAYALSGRPEEGIGLLKSAVEQTSSMKILVNHAAELVWLAEACLIGGLVNEAGSYGRQAYDLAKEHRERGNEASALRLLGDVASCRDSSQVDSITDQYGQALALATELRMLPLVAHCHLSLGTLLRRAGHEKRAKEHLTTATTMYQEMGMAFWLEKAEAAFRLP